MKEKELRRSLKRLYGESLFWIEAGRGGTVGMPDGMIVQGGNVWFVELKVWDRSDEGWTVYLRPSQAACIRQLLRNGASVYIYVCDSTGTHVELVCARNVFDEQWKLKPRV